MNTKNTLCGNETEALIFILIFESDNLLDFSSCMIFKNLCISTTFSSTKLGKLWRFASHSLNLKNSYIAFVRSSSHSISILKGRKWVDSHFFFSIFGIYLIGAFWLASNVDLYLFHIKYFYGSIIATRNQKLISNVFQTSDHIFMFVNLCHKITFWS